MKGSIVRECFYKDSGECTGDIVLSHSFQENGKLTILESMVKGNNLIYTPTSCVFDDHNLHKDLAYIIHKK